MLEVQGVALAGYVQVVHTGSAHQYRRSCVQHMYQVSVQRNQQGLSRPVLIVFAAEDTAKTRSQTTALPVKSHTELIGPVSWHFKQRVGMYILILFRTGMAFKFDRLYLCLVFSHCTSYTQGQCFFSNRSTYTTTEQILHRSGHVHRHMRQW